MILDCRFAIYDFKADAPVLASAALKSTIKNRQSKIPHV